jgi:HK97 family phage prohead protease
MEKIIERYKTWTKGLGLPYSCKYVGDTDIEDIDEKTRTVKFYFSTFGVIDSYGEITGEGAFKKTMKENFKRIKHLKNHDRNLAVAKVREVGYDLKGAWMLSEFIDTQLSRESYEEYIKEVITEHSYGYDPIKWHKENLNNQDVLILDEVRLWEASSLTGWGANPETPVIELKDIPKEELIKIVNNFSPEEKQNFLKSVKFDELEIKELLDIVKRNWSL